MILVLSQSQNSSGNWQVVVKLKCMLDTLCVYVWLCPLFWMCSQGRGGHLIVNTINNCITIASIVNQTFLIIETSIIMLLVDPAHLSASLGKNVLECNRGANTLSWGVEHEGNIIVHKIFRQQLML